jgi:hypothetical protein
MLRVIRIQPGFLSLAILEVGESPVNRDRSSLPVFDPDTRLDTRQKSRHERIALHTAPMQGCFSVSRR